MRIIRGSQATEFRSLIIGVLLASVTAYLLLVVGKTGTLSGIEQALVIIAGMTAVSALSAFERFMETKPTSSVAHLSFNEAFASKSIAEGFVEPTVITVEAEEIAKPEYFPWELNPGQLVGADNSLALAKLRIEIERELRRIAYDNQVDISTRPLGIVRLAQELASKEVIPTTWLGALREITSVCNQAIHGLEVPDDLAASVVRVGDQLLGGLRSVSIKSSNYVQVQAP